MGCYTSKMGKEGEKMKIAFAYTGQGSQKIGMGLDFLDEFPILKEKIEIASDIAQIDFLKLYKTGPIDALNYTPNTQPAVVLFEALVTDLLQMNGIRPAAALGHSLGEYSALYAAQVLDFNSLIKITVERGILMQKHADKNPGTMAVILGLGKETIKVICDEVNATDVVSISNINSPLQIVISGSKDAVAKASESAKSKGAKRVVPLKVSGPFHSAFMSGAKEEFDVFLQNVPFANANIDFISNNHGQVLRNANEIKHFLIEQFTTGVDWVSCIESLKILKVSDIIEIGPTSILSSMIRKTDPEFKTYSLPQATNLKNLLQNFSQ